LEGLSRLFRSEPMKIMLLIALAGLLALPRHVRAEPVVDCGSFPNSQMRLTCWNDTSRALQAYNPGQMPNDIPSLRANGSGSAGPMTGSGSNPAAPRTGLLRRKSSSQ
jgi:hypothetical protein